MDEQPRLEAAVKTWLEKTGYSLEYKTHESFRRAGLESTMGFFVRSHEGKYREIDVTACEKGLGRCFRVMCECKYADRPFVMLYSGVAADMFVDWLSLPKSDNFPRIPRESFGAYTGLLKDSWHFGGEKELAHSTVQAFVPKDDAQPESEKAHGKADKNNRDFAYEALQKIVHATWDHAGHGVEDGEMICPTMIMFPCLVVETDLFAARLDRNSGEFRVDRIKYGRLAWLGFRDRTIVDVVQASALDDYAGMVKGTIGIINFFLNELFTTKRGA